MRNILLITTFVFLTAFYPIDKLGGNFNSTPEQTGSKLSSGVKELIRKAYADIDSSKLVDYHTHIVGLDEKQGTSVNPKMLSWWHPINRIKTSVYLSGSGVSDLEKANDQYVERLVKLIRSNPHNGKHQILAFDYHYNSDGTINHDKSEFYVSNDYIWKLSQKYPDIFTPVISVHPYRKDATAELTKWAEKGLHWVKWLPNAHGIDASNPKLDEYYKVMKKYDMTLLTHVGEEQAVEADEDQKLGNPLLFRRPLDMGIKVVMAHCASLGEDEDFDNDNKKVSSFDLFIRMMDNPKYDGLLYGEISAMTQFNRLPKPLLTLLERTDLHHRLINGSDYPLPAINVVIHTRALVKYGMITKQEREYLNEIYKYNPLVFDYVLKRTIRHPKLGTGFNKAVFEELI